MTSQNALQLDPSATGVTLPGCWKLGAGRAVTLRPQEAGVLRVSSGQVWVTLDGPHRGHGNELGDYFLSPGESLAIGAGQRLVLESWDAAGPAPAWFSWDPRPVGARVPHGAAVLQPLGDLRLAVAGLERALGGVTGAVLRLATGLAGFALDLVVSRKGLAGAERAFSADSKASRAHGAIHC